jgi:transcriptional regulator with XRE-family HTH domain
MYRVDNAPVSPSSETARRVRAARAYAGLSVTELANRIGLGLQTIKRIESGKRTARPFEVWAIAEACGLPREFFEIDLDLLSRRASILQETLIRIDERLERLERRVGQPGFEPGTDGL